VNTSSVLRRRSPSRAEAWCVLGFVVVLVTAIAAPPIEQPAEYHAFADARTWAGVPNAANVLSNVVFAIAAALVAALALRTRGRLPEATRAGLGLTAFGLLLTAVGSAWYHRHPDNATLVWDRLPITVTFAGLIAVALAQRVSARLAWLALPALSALGLASVFYWKATGNVAPYGALQIGAMAGLFLIVALTRKPDDPLPWWWLIVGYGIAKVGEFYDGAVFDATRGVVSGHTLKHLVAGAAAAAFAWPLFARR
jgi:hypothetical protein